jgi:RHS repeat-associated protein
VLYAYDAAGRLITKTDANENTIGYAYNISGRLVQKSFPDGSVVQYQYDTQGRVTYAGNAYMAYSLSYDAVGRLTGVTDSGGRTVSYTYDSAGRRASMSAPEFGTLAYSYNDAGRLSSIDSPAGKFTFTYDGLGRRASLVYPNGTKGAYEYDENGRLVSLVHSGHNGEVLRSFSYGLDTVGNRVVKETESDTLTYSYDALYRLVGAMSATPGWSGEEGNAYGHDKGNNGNGKAKGKNREHPGKGNAYGKYKDKDNGVAQALLNQMETYAYDSVGNRLTGPDRNDAYAYNAANQLLSSSFADYEYDLNGNLIYKVTDGGVVSYRYDYENRLVRVTMPSGTVVEFAYDPFGRRVGKAVNGKWTYYFYDNEDILYEYSQSGTIGNMYVHGTGIDEPLALKTRKGDYYYHADGLGSVVALTDKRARVVQDYEYDSFGNLKDRKNRVKQPYAFTGREYDRETGLYYYRARYYMPEIGRFISADPIGFFAGEMNLYSYVRNKPLDFTDPTGLDVTITITRTTYTSVSIVGTIEVTSTVSSLTFSGYTLEETTPPNPNLPVPPGTYDAFVRTDHTPNRVQLIDVPDATAVQIHNGNTVDDVTGCFLAGTTTTTDFVGNSVSAMNSIINIINDDGCDNITVIVSGNTTGP